PDHSQWRVEPRPGAHANLKFREREITHVRVDVSEVDEPDAFQPSIDRKPQLAVQDAPRGSALGVAQDAAGPEIVLAIAAHAGRAARIEAFARDQLLVVEGPGEAEARRRGRHEA